VNIIYSTAALHSFTQSTRAQLSKSHVRVVEVIPPVFETDAARTTEEETPKLERFADHVIRDLEAGMEEIYYHSENIVRGTRNELDRLAKEWSNKGGEDVFSQSKA
jgi:short-subunit dehydrogenase involved in D-alanine esterification of teichoic acids